MWTIEWLSKLYFRRCAVFPRHSCASTGMPGRMCWRTHKGLIGQIFRWFASRGRRIRRILGGTSLATSPWWLRQSRRCRSPASKKQRRGWGPRRSIAHICVSLWSLWNAKFLFLLPVRTDLHSSSPVMQRSTRTSLCRSWWRRLCRGCRLLAELTRLSRTGRSPKFRRHQLLFLSSRSSLPVEHHCSDHWV